MRAPDFTVGPYRERNTTVIRATIQDLSDPPIPVPGSLLVTLTWTLYSEHGTQAIINSRDHLSIVTEVDESGELTLLLETLDMAIVDAEARATEAIPATTVMEYHRILLEYSWLQTGFGSPAPVGEASAEIRVIVRDLNLVPV